MNELDQIKINQNEENKKNYQQTTQKLQPVTFKEILKFFHSVFKFCTCYYISFHGEVIEKILKNENINQKKLYINVEDIPEKLYKELLEYLKKKLHNKIHHVNHYNYTPLKLYRNKKFYNNFKKIENIQVECCEIKFEIARGCIIYLIFHTEDLDDIVFHSDNLCLNKYGLCIYNSKVIQNYGKKFDSLIILDIINSIQNNNIKMININKLEKRSNRDDAHLFNLIHLQNMKLNSGKKVVKGFTNTLDKKTNCPICYKNSANTNLYNLKCNHVFCYECVEKHINSSENKTCPLCRQDIKFKFKKTTKK